MAGFYLWTLHSARGDLQIGPGKQDYYNLLVDGFQAGHLHMATPVDPALLALPAEQRPGNAPYLLDASLFEGRYYLYFGVVPAVLLHWPFAALTGKDLPDALAVWVIALAALGAGFLWWRELRRQLWPALGPSLDWLAIVALGLGTGVPAVLRRPLFYEEATLSGWLSGAVMLWALLRAQGARGRGAGWLILAGAACGLAAGSRANLVLAAVATLSVGAVLAGRRFAPGSWRGALVALVLTAAGALPVGLALAGYNYARFGSIVEFGHSHQLGHNPEQMFRVTNLTHNLGLYYGKPPELNAYFPYVLPPAEEAKPVDYIGRESVHGEWLWLVAALAAVPSVAFARRRGGWLVVPVLAWFVGNLLVTGLLGVRANRYMLDFHPALVCIVLAGLGWIAMERSAGRMLWRGGLVALVLLAAGFNVFASFQVHGFFVRSDPVGFQRLAARLDALVWRLMPGAFGRVGDWETGLQFPPAGTGGVMPLLTSGVPEFRDRLWLRLDGQGRAAFEFNHGDYGTARGADFPYEPGAKVRLRMSGAMLLPPVWHGWYGVRSAEERAALKRRLRLWADGVPVFDREVPSFSSAPWLQQWAVLQQGIVEVRPPDTTWLSGLADRRGAVRMSLRLPGDRYGSSEPLFQSGVHGAWDVVMVHYTRPGFARLRHDSVGKGAVTSEEFAVDYEATHLVEIESPFVHDEVVWNQHDTLLTSKVEELSVRWNGRAVLQSALPPHPATAATVTLGMNDFSSGCRASFAGELAGGAWLEALPGERAAAWRRTLDAKELLVGDQGTLLQWMRPDQRQGAVVWRRVGGAVQMGWVDNGFVHWAESAIGVPSGVLEFAVDSASETSAQAGESLVPFRLSWDGQELLAGDTDFFGLEPVAGHGLDAAGWQTSPEQAASGRATGGPVSSMGAPGRIALYLALPEGGLRESAPLLTAGRTGRADAVFLRPVGPGTYVVGVDHWGVAAYASEPRQLSSGKRLEVMLEVGSLFEGDDFTPDRVRVVIDGMTVLDVRTPLHPVGPGEVWIGRNTLGFSTCGEVFPGKIFSVRHRVP